MLYMQLQSQITNFNQLTCDISKFESKIRAIVNEKSKKTLERYKNNNSMLSKNRDCYTEK